MPKPIIDPQASLPPLPELQIHSYVARSLNQETVDCLIKAIYEKRPDIIRAVAQRTWDGLYGEEMKQDIIDSLYDFLSEKLKIDVRTEGKGTATHIYSELQNRILLMYNIPKVPPSDSPLYNPNNGVSL